MRQKHKNFYILLFSVFVISGCQVNETLYKIKETISVDFNKGTADKRKQDEKMDLKRKNEKISSKKSEETSKKISVEKAPKKVIKDTKIKKTEQELAFVQPRVKSKTIEKFRRKRELSKIGLLVPISGDRAYAGGYVIDSLRLGLAESNSYFNFQVLDTKGTKSGLMQAFFAGIENDIDIFIGPIFSDLTHYLKSLKINKDVLIFSLSSDQEAASNNIFISGTNPVDEIRCIFQNINSRDIKKVAIVQTKNKFSEKFSDVFRKFSADKIVDFFNIDTKDDLEEKIKSISNYDNRRRNLEQKIDEINAMEVDEEMKNNMRKNLETLETYGPPAYDAVIISEMGTRLVEIVSLMAYYDLNSENSFIVGMSGWDSLEDARENVFNGTYYVSNINNESKNYDTKYFNIFSKKPNKINYITHDLFIILEKLSLFEPPQGVSEISFEGTLGKTSVGKDSISREILFKKFKNGVSQIENICKL